MVRVYGRDRLVTGFARAWAQTADAPPEATDPGFTLADGQSS